MTAPVEIDNDALRSLAEQLDSDELAARDEATAALCRLGPAALPEILGHLPGRGRTGRVRLGFVHERIKARQQDRLLDDSPNVTAEGAYRGALAATLRRLARKTNAFVEVSGAPPDVRVEAEFDSADPLAAVEMLCSATGHGWKIDADGVLHLAPDPRGPHASAGGGLCVARLHSVTVERRTNFRESLARASVSLSAAIAWPLVTLRPPELREVTAILDDADEARTLSVAPSSEPLRFDCRLDALPRGARAITRLRATLVGQFATNHDDIVIDAPTEGTIVKSGDVCVRVDSVRDTELALSVYPSNWGQRTLDLSSDERPTCAVAPDALGRDADDREEMVSTRTLQSDKAALYSRLVLEFQRLRPASLSRVVLPVARQIVTRRFALEFRDLALP